MICDDDDDPRDRKILHIWTT